ncbi:MAG: hypothetical protein R3D88_09610 [Alphaproteobacteria bacterium]
MQNRLYIITLFILILLTGVRQSAAQERLTPADAEDVAIAFYKTGGLVPNFKNWIEEREPYNLTPLALRPQVMEEELLRLNTAYKNFNPEKDFLIVKTTALLKTQKNVVVVTDEQGEETEKNEYELIIRFDQKSDVLYFPYQFLEQNIMIVPLKLKDLKTTPLNKLDFERIRGATSENIPVPFILRLRAQKADIEQPYEVDGFDQWALSTEVVSMETWNENGSLLWEYSAPWYVSPHSEKIHKLYDEREKQELEFDETKAVIIQ